MQAHTKNYFDFFNIDYDPISGWHDHINCELCGSTAIDLHHIENRIKGIKILNRIDNIIALCRQCHEKAHANAYGYSKDYLKQVHENIMNNNKILIHKK